MSMQMKQTQSKIVMLMISLAGIVACNDAGAMARSPASVPTTIPETAPIRSGTYDQGFDLGLRNGQILSERLRDRTVGTHGCSAVGAYQDALVRVSRTVRPPMGDDSLIRGFFRGYIDAIRENIRDAREGCHMRRFSDGNFAGQFYGSLMCRAATINLDLAVSISFESLYDGWSGGSDEVMSQCRSSATVVLMDCGQDDLSSDIVRALSMAIGASCADRL